MKNLKSSFLYTLENNTLFFFTVLIAFLLISRSLYLIFFGNELEAVQALVDDGFYYLQIANNLGKLGISSADFGLTLTSGYHPLWAFLLIPLTQLGLTQSLELKLFILICLFFTGSTIIFILYYLKNRSNFSGLLAFCVLLSAYSWVTNSFSGVEWPIVVLINFIIFYLYSNLTSKFSRSWIFFGLGILGSLARSDFILIPGTLFFIALIYYFYSYPKPIYPLRNALLILGGTIFGLILESLYFYCLTGQFIQGSAAVKALWAEHYHYKFDSVIFQFVRIFLYLNNFSHEINVWVHVNFIYIFCGFILVALTLGFLLKPFLDKVIFFSTEEFRKSTSQVKIVYISCPILIVLYFFAYGLKVVEIQPWYTAQITIPILIILTCVFSAIFSVASNRNYKYLRKLTLLVIFLIISFNIFASFLEPWPYPEQIYNREHGLLYKEQFKSKRVASSGSGIVNFYQGGTTINLDGLVNNEIYAFMPNLLPCYLIHKKIDIFDNFGASEVFFHMQNSSYYGELTTIYGPESSPFKIYATNPEKINENYNCKNSLAIKFK